MWHGFHPDLARAARFDLERRAEEQARVHEALLAGGTATGAVARFLTLARRRRTEPTSQPMRLTCGNARRWISLSLDAALHPAFQTMLDAHLAGCGACARQQATLAGLTTTLRAAGKDRWRRRAT